MLRRELLIKLLTYDLSMDELSNKLNKFYWDSDGELVSLERKHILNILKKYLAGSVSAVKVEDWANLIESREDIGREKFHEDVINEILHELANPLLTEQLTQDRAEILITKIS